MEFLIIMALFVATIGCVVGIKYGKKNANKKYTYLEYGVTWGFGIGTLISIIGTFLLDIDFLWVGTGAGIGVIFGIVIGLVLDYQKNKNFNNQNQGNKSK